jgi:hypothetical protein
VSLIARLIEAGTPAELIEEVAMMVAEKRAAEKAMQEARDKARERQARKRERDMSRDVTQHNVTECDIDRSPPCSPPNDIYSNPPLNPPITKSSVRDAFPCPDWCDRKVWADLKRNRKTKRLTNTETAHAEFLRDIAKLATDEWPPGEVVRAIVARGWGGAYDPRQSQNDRKPANVRTAPSNRNTAELALAKLGMAGG